MSSNFRQPGPTTDEDKPLPDPPAGVPEDSIRLDINPSSIIATISKAEQQLASSKPLSRSEIGDLVETLDTVFVLPKSLRAVF